MTDAVNELHGHLSAACDLALQCWKMNSRNYWALKGKDADALNEKRPLTIPQRIKEAEEYRELFGSIEEKIRNIAIEIASKY